METSREPIVHRLARVASTQRVARDYIELGAARAGHVVLADEQSEGAGRRGREWLSPLGGFYATFVVPQDHLLAVRAGVAVARALEGLSVPVRLKWPNDLLLGPKKLGGILIETAGRYALVGVGVNLDSSPVVEATCLREAGVAAERTTLALAIHRELVRPLPDAELLAAYRERLDTIGRPVRVDRDDGAVVGTAVDIDADGRLLVETDGQRIAVAAGDCFHLRAA